jgi:hypothetical protein
LTKTESSTTKKRGSWVRRDPMGTEAMEQPIREMKSFPTTIDGLEEIKEYWVGNTPYTSDGDRSNVIAGKYAEHCGEWEGPAACSGVRLLYMLHYTGGKD